MFSHIPRRAKVSIIYGIPGVDSLMQFSFLNIPELLETYGIVEIIWFNTDMISHIKGLKSQRDSIHKFDRYFGQLSKRLNLKEINIIFYSDHGMSFGEFNVIKQDKEIKRIIGNNPLYYNYPNLYLKRPEEREKAAKDIVSQSKIDFTFYREDAHRVVGYSSQGKVTFEAESGKYRYLYQDNDVFGYYGIGYNGEWLTAIEWLLLTKRKQIFGSST